MFSVGCLLHDSVLSSDLPQPCLYVGATAICDFRTAIVERAEVEAFYETVWLVIMTSELDSIPDDPERLAVMLIYVLYELVYVLLYRVDHTLFPVIASGYAGVVSFAGQSVDFSRYRFVFSHVSLLL